MRQIGDISVIIPCYCCSETVERAFNSVLSQTLLPIEIILVDDASEDHGATLDCLRGLLDKQQGELPEVRMQLIELDENSGPAGARNTAWEAASAEYLAFLDADDAWHPQKLEIQYAWMRTHPEIAMSGHQSVLAEALPSDSSVDPAKVMARPCMFRAMLFRNTLLTRTVMIRRDVSRRFPAGKRYSEDYLLWLQLLASGYRASVLDVVLAYSFKHEYGAGGLSRGLWRMERGELENYRLLYKSDAIGMGAYLSASLFSLLKYLRRFAIVAGRFGRSS